LDEDGSSTTCNHGSSAGHLSGGEDEWRALTYFVRKKGLIDIWAAVRFTMLLCLNMMVAFLGGS
jgi:hypothetical protein